MKIAVSLLLVAALATAVAAADRIADTDVGLVKGSVLDVPTPPAVKANESVPGERPARPRPYAIAPPRVPHGVADFLPITVKDNACVGCHEVKDAKPGDRRPGEPTPIPPSHYTDERNAPGGVGASLAGARHVCTSCHVATTDAADLVENRFRP